jgi:hypothetical protein
MVTKPVPLPVTVTPATAATESDPFWTSRKVVMRLVSAAPSGSTTVIAFAPVKAKGVSSAVVTAAGAAFTGAVLTGVTPITIAMRSLKSSFSPRRSWTTR